MITIVTPTYNRANTLIVLYQSPLAQTSKDFDWLIIDDGSQDNTKEICNNKGGEKKNIRANKIKDIKNENRKGYNRSANNRYKRHVKFRSMKLDDFYGIKGRKKNSKYMHINTNEN